ncbi:condensation domain-containing protein [Streptomyces sp. NBC_00223]|nr:condensation domain-containing protein [Streptomyces sp. NBC_00223]
MSTPAEARAPEPVGADVRTTAAPAARADVEATAGGGRRALALRLLAARRRAGGGERGIPRQPRDGRPLECSAEQRRVWLAERMGEPGVVPPSTAALALEGPLEPARLTTALATVVNRHPILRTRYTAEGSEPRQIPPAAPLTPREANALVDTVDLSVLPEDEREPVAQSLAVEAGDHRFDLATGPMLRLTVLRLAPDSHRLLLVCHHIAADGRSMEILLAELASAYRALATDAQPPQAPPGADRADYADYAAWSRRRLDRVLPERLAYWRHRLAGAPPLLDADLPAPARRPHPGERRTATALAHVDAATLDRLRSAGGTGSQLTAHTALLAGFLVLLGRCADRDDLTVGVVWGGRSHPELDDVVGCFTDLLPLRVSVAAAPDFGRLAVRVRDTLAAAFAQAAPFDQVVSAVAPRRAPGVHPLFQVLFVQREEALTYPDDPAHGWGPGFAQRPWGREVNSTAYDFTLAATVGPEGAELVLTYPLERFSRQAVDLLAQELTELYALLAARPQEPVGELRTAEAWRNPERDQDRDRDLSRDHEPAAGDLPPVRTAEAGDGDPPPSAREAETVAELRALWREVLGRDDVDDHGDLFALGGDSLAVVRIVARIEERFGAEVPIRVFFDSPTPAGFGAALTALLEEERHVR